ALNPLKNVQYETLLPIPLIVGNEIIGLINCYASAPLHYQEDDQLMLLTLANQAALAIKHRLFVEEEDIAHKARSKAFIDDLLSGNPLMDDTLCRRAHTLGLDLTRPHAVALIEVTDSNESTSETEPNEVTLLAEHSRLYEDNVEFLQQQIQTHYPGSFVTEREGVFVCLLCLGDNSSPEQLTDWLESIAQQIQFTHHVRLTAGVSNACDTIGDYRRGYAEASEALDVGASICHERGCIHFNTLGAYRYIYHFAHTDILRDHYQEQVTVVADYDQRKKTTLLDTLEAYLECGCNIARAATQLDIHRNTLLQRMERVQKLCTLDLEQVQNRLPLLIALKVHKLRTHTA
ncbi:MAG TPA: helix-turn-helix domain-containing protein, partial [Ktedonobacteraceae bacterium]